MAILKMKKLSLIAPQENAQKLIEDLMWLSCVEIIPQEEKETTQDVHKVRLRMEKLTSALGEIAKYRTKKGLFGAHEEVSRQSFDAMAEDADRIYGLCDKVLELKEEYARLQNRVNSLDSQILQLMPWRDYGFSLANTTTEQCDITLGTLPTSCDIDALAESEEEKSFYILPIVIFSKLCHLQTHL